MTVILILACLSIVAAELYLARGSRRVTDRLDRLEVALAQIREPAGPDRGDLPDAREDTPEGERADGRAERIGAELARLGAEVARLGGESARLRDRLSLLEGARDTERDRSARLAQAVDALEQLVGDLCRDTLSRLDEDVAGTLGGVPPGPGADSGTVCGSVHGTPAAPPGDTLLRAYERAAAGVGLEIRFRARDTTAPWHARYFLRGKTPRELERDFLALLGSVRSEPAGPAVAAFRELLLALDGLPAGFAQIGPMVAERTPDALRCGVLTLAECRDLASVPPAERPAAITERLSALPPDRVGELTADLPAWAASA